jgi:hydroxymethylglutaryl-CoA lyase
MKIIECPRDAIQGLKQLIPTEAKIRYINELLQAGFDTIDFGSFVSAKTIPQLADTAEVVKKLDLSGSTTKLLAIVVNERGAREACTFDQITYLGYPFSVSETFQKRNTGASIAESLDSVRAINDLCRTYGKELVIYISMGFGNPYGDKWDAPIVMKWVNNLSRLGINIFSVADTAGIATSENINYLFGHLKPTYPGLEFGAHFHINRNNWFEKIAVAYAHGIRRFDSAMLGFGGCPMSGNDLVGNLPTDKLPQFMEEKQLETSLTKETITHLEQSFQQLISS